MVWELVRRMVVTRKRWDARSPALLRVTSRRSSTGPDRTAQLVPVTCGEDVTAPDVLG